MACTEFPARAARSMLLVCTRYRQKDSKFGWVDGQLEAHGGRDWEQTGARSQGIGQEPRRRTRVEMFLCEM